MAEKSDPSLAITSPNDVPRSRDLVDTLAFQAAQERKDYMDTQLQPFMDARVTPTTGNLIDVDEHALTCTFGDHEGNIQDAVIPLPRRLVKPAKMEGHTGLFLFRWSDETYYFDMLVD